MKAGRFEPSDQCLLHAYWASYPDRVRIDSNAAVFASFKRFYVLEADDRGVRTPGCAPSINQSMAVRLRHCRITTRLTDLIAHRPRRRRARAGCDAPVAAARASGLARGVAVLGQTAGCL